MVDLSKPQVQRSTPKRSKWSGVIIVAAVAICLLTVVGFFGGLLLVAKSDWSEMKTREAEITAMQTIDKIRIFQAQYAARNKGNYASFAELVKTGLDEKFLGERPIVDGYIFDMTVVSASNSAASFYKVNADPVASQGVHLYTDSTIGTIRRTDENRQAKADDPAL